MEKENFFDYLKHKSLSQLNIIEDILSKYNQNQKENDDNKFIDLINIIKEVKEYKNENKYILDFKIIDIADPYIVNDNNCTKTYKTLIDIAQKYNSNISNIYKKVCGNKNVKTLEKINIIKIETPYVIEYNDKIYRCETLKDISIITGVCITKVHRYIEDYLLNY